MVYLLCQLTVFHRTGAAYIVSKAVFRFSKPSSSMTDVSFLLFGSAYLSKGPSGLLAVVQVEQQSLGTASAGGHSTYQ